MSLIHQKPAEIDLHCSKFQKIRIHCAYGTDYECFIIKQIILISNFLIFFFLDGCRCLMYISKFVRDAKVEVHFNKRNTSWTAKLLR